MKPSEWGGTLLSQLVVLMIMSVVLSTGLPATFSLIDAQARRNALIELQSAIALARATSAEKGVYSVIDFNSDGSSFSLGLDYRPYSSPPAIETSLKTVKLTNGISFSTSGSLNFNSQGFLVDGTGNPTSVSFSITKGSDSFQEVTVYPTGWVEVNL